MDNIMVLNGIDIHDIEMLSKNINDRYGLLKAFRNGTLHDFLESCFYTDEAEAIAGISDTKDDALYNNLVDVLTGNAPEQVIAYGRSDLKKPERTIPEYKKWDAYLKEKSRAFRKKYNPVYSKRSAPLLKKLRIDEELSCVAFLMLCIHDHGIFQQN